MDAYGYDGDKASFNPRPAVRPGESLEDVGLVTVEEVFQSAPGG